MSAKKVIFVVGPTASGKTALSIALAKEFNGEIISADSMQIYKGIHIASAAPDAEETEGIPHHLLEFLDLDCRFSVADYVKAAREKIEEILYRGRLPIVVGGTGLYISALLDNTEFCQSETDLALRQRLEKEFDELGGEAMLNRLREIDPESAQKLHISDKRRIIRCFEIYEATGNTKTHQNELSHQNERDFDALVLGITFKERERLYDRINLRVDKMIEAGLLEEARLTFNQNADGSGAFQAIGHKELYGFFEGGCTLEEATELLKQQTRRYAKRQLTWFRRDERICWLYPDCENALQKAFQAAKDFLK